MAIVSHGHDALDSDAVACGIEMSEAPEINSR
jgi:hypothetical protein